MSFDCCRSSGSCANPLLLNRASGSIPGAVPGSIPEEFAARDPIYFDGLVSLDEFLASTNNDLDMRPATAQESLFSILSGGQSQKRVAELEKILERNLHTK